MTVMHVMLKNCEESLLDQIADKHSTRHDVAWTYALAIRSIFGERCDWAKVNKAIIARWSVSGLHWIKREAWSGKRFTTRIGKLSEYDVI